VAEVEDMAETRTSMVLDANNNKTATAEVVKMTMDLDVHREAKEAVEAADMVGRMITTQEASRISMEVVVLKEADTKVATIEKRREAMVTETSNKENMVGASKTITDPDLSRTMVVETSNKETMAEANRMITDPDLSIAMEVVETSHREEIMARVEDMEVEMMMI
jgi:hypothetical protein